jgi:hypothetical protein
MLGLWGHRWVQHEVRREDLDPSLLMWDMRRGVNPAPVPADRRMVIQFDLTGVAVNKSRWWLVFDRGEVDLCLTPPGYAVDLHVTAHIRALVDLPGDDGLARVLVTTLGRAWMPLLRYDIGDVVCRAQQRQCPCGLASDGPLLARVEGRQSDCIDVSGTTVTPLMLDDAIHAALGPRGTLEQWQLAGDSLLVVDSGAEDSGRVAADAVSAVIERAVRAERVGAIAPEVSGKYRLVKR